MPEGDSIHQAAARLRGPLVGATVDRLEGSHRAVIAHGRRMTGATVTAIESRGKHLLIRFDNGWALRTHLGMTGRWHIYAAGERWRASPGKARAVLRTPGHVAVCFAAPTVELAPADRIEQGIDHLGPDLAADDFDADEAVRRAAGSNAATAADLLLDQRVMAGVGNAFKSEVLFLEGIHPATPAAQLDATARVGLVARSRRLIVANLRAGPRTTTGDRGRGRELWVYGRGGRACRRCRARIESGELGTPPRVTYWCPRCQSQTGPDRPSRTQPP